VNSAPLTASDCAALRTLLDDPSPAVRRALLVRLAGAGATAAAFLQEVARDRTAPSPVTPWPISTS
jgi:hypothetical protein